MTKRLYVSLCFAIVTLCFATTNAATTTTNVELRLPEIFDNNMVLQRDMPVPIWGWADPGEEIAVTLETPVMLARTTPVIADDNGRWKVSLPPLPASTEPGTLTVKGKNEIRLTNILIGDVWLCSGQSNMEWSMTQSCRAEYEELLKTVDNPNIRLFHVRRQYSAAPLDALPVTASWTAISAESIPHFSAVALHFGRKLHAELDVPIGLINSSWGGTRIEPWTPPVGFQSVPALQSIVDGLAQNPEPSQWQPTMLYNAMIHPLVPFAMRGAIWYQGESNVGEGMLYADKMKALIQGWREVFNNPDLGFYYVQLAPFIYGNQPPTRLPELWEAQSAVEKMLPKTGQAVINDTVDDIHDIHPISKRPVGERLALLALNRTYGKSEVVCASPEFDRMEIEADTLIVYFNNAQVLRLREPSITTDDRLNWFEIAGADGIYYPAELDLDALRRDRAAGGQMRLHFKSPRVPSPVAIRYAWDQSARPRIHNEAGLPLGAFRAGTVPE